MKLAPLGGMMTSLVEVSGTIAATGWESGKAAELVALETFTVAESASAGIPARANDAVAAPFNKSRREILSMIEVPFSRREKKQSAF
jgi:hypothetical protein